jgi:hypothetical protein
MQKTKKNRTTIWIIFLLFWLETASFVFAVSLVLPVIMIGVGKFV